MRSRWGKISTFEKKTFYFSTFSRFQRLVLCFTVFSFFQVPIPVKPDSNYKGKKQVRPKKRTDDLVVPKSLQKALPYKLKTEVLPKNPADTRQHLSWTADSVAVIQTEREQKVAALLERLNVIRKYKLERSRLNKEKQMAEEASREKFIQEKR
jgi:ribosome biogenesis protein BMS1